MHVWRCFAFVFPFLPQACDRSGARPIPPAEVTSRSTSSEQRPSGLTEARLAKLNDLCADTFCEGSFSYSFHSLACDRSAASCTFGFRMSRAFASTSGGTA
jgi:hypothetical protein